MFLPFLATFHEKPCFGIPTLFQPLLRNVEHLDDPVQFEDDIILTNILKAFFKIFESFPES